MRELPLLLHSRNEIAYFTPTHARLELRLVSSCNQAHKNSFAQSEHKNLPNTALYNEIRAFRYHDLCCRG
jgi:hypothetical protein